MYLYIYICVCAYIVTVSQKTHFEIKYIKKNYVTFLSVLFSTSEAPPADILTLTEIP